MPKNKNGDHFCTPTSPPNCVLDICGVRLSHQAFILRTLAHSPHKPSYQPLVCCSVHLTTKVSFQIGRPLKIISIFSYPAMLTTLRETLVIGTFNIGLPTTDVGTDGALIYKLFGGFPYHPNCTDFLHQPRGPSSLTSALLIQESRRSWSTRPTRPGQRCCSSPSSSTTSPPGSPGTGSTRGRRSPGSPASSTSTLN